MGLKRTDVEEAIISLNKELRKLIQIDDWNNSPQLKQIKSLTGIQVCCLCSWRISDHYTTLSIKVFFFTRSHQSHLVHTQFCLLERICGQVKVASCSVSYRVGPQPRTKKNLFFFGVGCLEIKSVRPVYGLPLVLHLIFTSSLRPENFCDSWHITSWVR